MEAVNIVFSSDKNYTQLMGVALCSIFENKKHGYDINIHVLDGGILEKDMDKLKILEKKYHFKINYIKIDTLFFKDFYTEKAFTQAVYYRIMIPKLLPNLKKVLYLDTDTVVIDDIYELYNTNINNYLYAAVEDKNLTENKERYADLKIPLNEKYFNSGVLLINIDKCNEVNATETIIKFINDNKDKLKYVDQDAINATMKYNILCLDQKYNCLAFFATPETAKNAKIIHYVWKKPWDYFYKNKLNEKYFYYLKKTPWKNLKYKNKTIKNIFVYYKKIYKKEVQLLSYNLVLDFKKFLIYKKIKLK